jgi:3-dehydroquinate dehydratase-2
MVNILVMNGPNLNLTGTREPEIYGKETFEQILDQMHKRYYPFTFEYYQSNYEGALIDKLQYSCVYNAVLYHAIIINPGALAHYSYALYDALRTIHLPKVEVHLSNIYKREDFRQKSVITAACNGSICGFGKESYFLAVEWLKMHFEKQPV